MRGVKEESSSRVVVLLLSVQIRLTVQSHHILFAYSHAGREKCNMSKLVIVCVTKKKSAMNSFYSSVQARSFTLEYYIKRKCPATVALKTITHEDAIGLS